MPLYHCTKCQHEWEGTKNMDVCDWCGAPGYILVEATPLELMLKHIDRVLRKPESDQK